MIKNILKASVRALKAASLYLASIGIKFYLKFKPGWSLSAGIYRTDYDFSLSAEVVILGNVLGPYSSITLNLGWLSVEVHASYGYGDE